MPERPQTAALRAALYRHAFNRGHPAPADLATIRVLDWVQRASLPVARLAEPMVLRQALDAFTLRLDGRCAAANTIIRKRAVFRGALGYAVETGLLEYKPTDRINWQARNPPRQSTPGSWRALPRPKRCWLRSRGSARAWQRSSAACTTARCVPKKPSPCV
jgi:hypothetical protein